MSSGYKSTSWCGIPHSQSRPQEMAQLLQLSSVLLTPPVLRSGAPALIAVTLPGSSRPQGLPFTCAIVHPGLTPVTDLEHGRVGLQLTPAGRVSVLSPRAHTVCRDCSLGPWSTSRRGTGWVELLINHPAALTLDSLGSSGLLGDGAYERELIIKGGAYGIGNLLKWHFMGPVPPFRLSKAGIYILATPAPCITFSVMLCVRNTI